MTKATINAQLERNSNIIDNKQVFGMCQLRICTSTIANIIIPYHTSVECSRDSRWCLRNFSFLESHEKWVSFKNVGWRKEKFFFLSWSRPSALWISVETRFGSRFKNNSNFPLLIESEMQSKAHREQKWKINTLPTKIGMCAIAETILQ